MLVILCIILFRMCLHYMLFKDIHNIHSDLLLLVNSSCECSIRVIKVSHCSIIAVTLDFIIFTCKMPA